MDTMIFYIQQQQVDKRGQQKKNTEKWTTTKTIFTFQNYIVMD
jgi:hypothetical protein